MFKTIFILVLFFKFFYSSIIFANLIDDQWLDSKKTYKDLVNDGFEIKSYDSTSLQLNSGLIILFFVTVLKKDTEVFECQEYQTFDENMITLNMSVVCRKLVQPYQSGIGT